MHLSYFLVCLMSLSCALAMILQAFVSEYAVHGDDTGSGNLYKALAEAAFLLGLERNRHLPLTIYYNLQFYRKIISDELNCFAVMRLKWQAMLLYL